MFSLIKTSSVATATTMFVDANGNPDFDTAYALAYLNQNEALAAQNTACLTTEELNAINNKNERENHPRNCAKLNAAFTPYFDVGPQTLRAEGRFTYFSSRNNNFSNRDQTGSICVDSAPAAGTTKQHICANAENTYTSKATTESTVPDGATTIQLPVDQAENGADAEEISADTDLVGVTYNDDNDATGDGDQFPCEETMYSLGSIKTEYAIGLAVGTLFIGMFFVLLVEFCCARCAARKAGHENVGFLEFIVNAVTWRGYSKLDSPTAAKPAKSAGRQQRTPSVSGTEMTPKSTGTTVTRPPTARPSQQRGPRTVPPPPTA